MTEDATEMTGNDDDDGVARRARARRMTILLALVAISFYVGFILMQVMGAR
jgi:hypothetical protein